MDLLRNDEKTINDNDNDNNDNNRPPQEGSWLTAAEDGSTIVLSQYRSRRVAQEFHGPETQQLSEPCLLLGNNSSSCWHSPKILIEEQVDVKNYEKGP